MGSSSPPWARLSLRPCAPSGEEAARILADKAYLESVYKAGAEEGVLYRRQDPAEGL